MKGKTTDAVVSSTGDVLFVDDQLVKLQCPEYYKLSNIWEPFNCTMKWGSWTQDGYKLDLKPKHGEVDLSDLTFSSLKVTSA